MFIILKILKDYIHEHALVTTVVKFHVSIVQEAIETLNTRLLSLRGWHQESSRLKYEGKMALIIPMINKFINRSGLMVR